MSRDVFESETTVQSWDQDYYHPISIGYYDRAVPDMLRAMGARPGDTVLDAGCGPGVHSIRAAKYGCRVHAIDLSERMLTHARERSARAGVSDLIEFRQDDLTNLSLASGSFNFAFSWGVIIHIPDTGKAIENLCRVVRPGGKLALHVLNANSVDQKIERLVRNVLSKPLAGLQETEFGTGNWYDYNDERLWVLRFDEAKLKSKMAGHGFRLISRRTAEFTELQTRVRGPLRSAILWANRAAYAMRLPAGLSCTQILIFENQNAV